MIKNSIKQDFIAQGYIVLRNFISEDEVLKLREICDNTPINIGLDWNGNGAKELPNNEFGEYWTVHIYDNTFINDIFNRYTPIAEKLFGGKPFHSGIANFKVTNPMGGKMAPHFDAPYDRPKWHNDINIDFIKCIQFGIVVDTFNKTTGGTMIWPGSHLVEFSYKDVLNGRYNSEFLKHGITIEAEPGDLLCFHARVMHSTMPNHSNHKRRLLLNMYFSNNETFKTQLLEKD